MKEEKKVYSRSEKLKYFAAKVAYYEYLMKRAQERLDFIASDKYQEWESDLAKELDEKKAAK